MNTPFLLLSLQAPTALKNDPAEEEVRMQLRSWNFVTSKSQNIMRKTSCVKKNRSGTRSLVFIGSFMNQMKSGSIRKRARKSCCQWGLVFYAALIWINIACKDEPLLALACRRVQQHWLRCKLPAARSSFGRGLMFVQFVSRLRRSTRCFSVIVTLGF